MEAFWGACVSGFELRDYQREAIAAVIAARKAGVRRMVVVLPTGAGKTVIFSSLVKLARRPVLVLAHRSELVQQAADKIRRALGTDARAARVAVEQAEQRAPEDAHVVVASIRSLHDERLARLMASRRFGLVVYDECHHAPAEGNRHVLQTLGAFSDHWDGTLLGFTATAMRADGKGLDTVFEKVVYSRSLPDLIQTGFLVPLRGYRIATAAELNAVRTTPSDLNEADLAEAIDIEDRNALVARSIQELARGRRTLAFCVTVRHARRLMRALNTVGVRAGMVWGEMRRDDRAEVLAGFREGRLQALTNVGVLTEGFDDPGVGCVAMARPTRSAGLYAQCVGRGTRLHPGKSDCIVLDFVDLSDLDLVTLPSLHGSPRNLDLQGEDAAEVAETIRQLLLAHPGFEVPPGAITLQEIKDRAAAFDPLDQHVDLE
ncbi:MAG TPA: ATP-dependent helicase, partial [Deltaproteobacteria bacterium]|nr:ATP-dependent helicase [Deltaproteobacteria bacterium]